MNVSEAYKAITSGQIYLRNQAHDDGWDLPQYREFKVVMHNRVTGETYTGRREWARSKDRWGKRVKFDL